MATAQKISQLTTAGPLTGAELVPIVQTSGTLQTTVSIIASYAVVTLALEVSAFGTRVEQVSAALSVNTAVVASVQADVSALDVRVAAVSASVSALQVQVNSVSTALTSTNNVVSALEVRVSSVSTAVSALTTRVALVSSSVSALQIQLNSVSAALTSTNNVVSALEVRVSSVSAAASANAASIVSTNAVISALDVRVSILEVAVSNIGDVSAIAALLPQVSNLAVAVSALEIRVSSVSSQVSTNTLAITSINNVVSALDIRVAAVSASVSALQVQLNAVSAQTSVNAAAITSINAVVSTKVNRVGDFMDSVQYIEFDTSTITATSVGRLVWDTEYGTLDIGLAGGNSNVLIGQREVMYVYNDTAATLTKGKVVEVTGAQGQRLTVKLAQADSDSNSATVLGIMLETVSVNASGYVATNGIVRNVNTGSFTDGQIVYLSPTTAGDLTVTKPVAPQHLVMIGYIVKGGSVGAGSIYVKTQNGYELGELHDVKVSSSLSIANGEILAYDTSANVWTNSMALINTQASVSVLQLQVDAVSAATSVNAAAIAAVSASVSALQVQVNNVSAALTSTNNVVSALEIRVSTVSAQASANKAQIDAVSVLVSALDLRVTNVSASVSALQVQLNNVSAVTSVNSAAITSINNVVSALEIRVSTVSAVASANTVRIDAVSVLVSTLQVQVNNVSSAVSAALVSVGQRVLKAGDTMTGALNISTSADAQAVSVAGYATFSSRVSISAGFYTGLQNYQDFTVQRPTFRDYGLVVVAKGSVSSAVSLDLTDGNYFEAVAAGSLSFVFVSPPVSVAGVAGRAAGGFILELQNGGAATVTWPAAVKWPSGTAPTLTSSGFDVFVFITDDGGTTWRGVQSMKDSK